MSYSFIPKYGEKSEANASPPSYTDFKFATAGTPRRIRSWIMFGISSVMWVVIAAVVCLLVVLVAVFRQQSHVRTDDIGEPPNPFRTLRFFIGVATIVLALTAINWVLNPGLWLALVFWPAMVALIIFSARLIGVIITLKEGEGINVDRWGGYHLSLFAFRGHVMLDRTMVELLKKHIGRCIVGEIVNVGEVLAQLDRLTSAGQGVSREVADAIKKFSRYARIQERGNNMFGGLRIVGWPWVDRPNVFNFETMEVVREEKDGVTRYQVKWVKRPPQTRLLLTDLPKELLLRGVETAPTPDQPGGTAAGYGFPVDLLVTPFVRVSHMYLAVYKTREGWAKILTNLLHPKVLSIVRGIEAGEVSNQLDPIGQRVLDAMQDESGAAGSDATALNERYGLKMIRFPIQDTQMSDPDDDTLLQLPTSSRVQGQSAVIKAEYDARVTVQTRQAEATGIAAIVRAAQGDPVTARLAIKADAAKNSKGTVIMNMDGGDGGAGIDPGTQVLISRIDRLTRALEKRPDSTKKGRGGETAEPSETDEDDEEEASA